MFPGMNPKKMQQMLKQMGIQQQEIDAVRVIIEKKDNTRTVIENPSVLKINMQGQQNYQISGDEHEEEGTGNGSVDDVGSGEEDSGISESDIKLVMEKANCSEEKAREALEKTNGDIAEAIVNLS